MGPRAPNPLTDNGSWRTDEPLVVPEPAPAPMSRGAKIGLIVGEVLVGAALILFVAYVIHCSSTTCD
jgi:hypothetical protein